MPNISSVPLACKSDRDRLRQRASARAARRKRIEAVVDRIIREHLVDGRPVAACFADLLAAARSEARR